MQISEVRLRSIVTEEVMVRLIEQIIEEELKNFLSENEDLEAYKQATNRELMAKVKKGLVPATAITALLGLLNQKTTNYADIKAAENELVYQLNIEKESTDEAQLDKFADQLNNTARYMWGVGDQGAMPVPGTDGKITVLPPSYSIAVRAFLDKKANMERVAGGEEPIMRYGDFNPENIPQIGGDYNYQGTYEENVKDFFNVYSGKDMIDAMKVVQKVPELDVVSGTGTEQMIIMVNPNKIDADYVLPELGMTASDYYNSQYGTFLGSGEKESLDTGEPEPELKENKITWKNYRNRKKKLA